MEVNPHRLLQVGKRRFAVRMRIARLEHACRPRRAGLAPFTNAELCPDPRLNMTRARANIILALMGLLGIAIEVRCLGLRESC